MTHTPDSVVIGIDVGSTTVKMTVVHPETREILWAQFQLGGRVITVPFVVRVTSG